MTRFAVALLLVMLAACDPPVQRSHQTGGRDDETSAEARVSAAMQAVLFVRVDGVRTGHCWQVRHGEAITANHVLGSGRGQLSVEWGDGRHVAVTVLRRDLALDLALLGLPSEAVGPTIEISPTNGVVAQRVFLLAAQNTPGLVAASGSVASRHAQFHFRPSVWDYWLVQFVTGPSCWGTSGAPWVDLDGRVIGLELGRVPGPGGVPTEVNFVVAAEQIKQFLDRPGRQPVSTIGAEFRTEPPDKAAPAPDLGGVWIHAMDPTGPLRKAGVHAGSLLLRVGAARATTVDVVVNEVRRHKPGTRLLIEVHSPEAPTRLTRLDVPLGELGEK